MKFLLSFLFCSTLILITVDTVAQQTNTVELLATVSTKTNKNLTNKENKDASINLLSVVICPNCGHSETELMKKDACKRIHICESCNFVVKTEKGNCCIYCEHGTNKCPTKQEEQMHNHSH